MSAFKDWYLEAFANADGEHDHLPEWHEHDAKIVWDVATSRCLEIVRGHYLALLGEGPYPLQSAVNGRLNDVEAAILSPSTPTETEKAAS